MGQNRVTTEILIQGNQANQIEQCLKIDYLVPSKFIEITLGKGVKVKNSSNVKQTTSTEQTPQLNNKTNSNDDKKSSKQSSSSSDNE